MGIELLGSLVQYTLANPNRGVQILKKSVPIREFVRISEVTLFIWGLSNTKMCDNPMLPVWSFNSLPYTLNICNEWCKLFTLSIQVNTCKYWILFEYEFWEWGVRISEVRINEGLLDWKWEWKLVPNPRNGSWIVRSLKVMNESGLIPNPGMGTIQTQLICTKSTKVFNNTKLSFTNCAVYRISDR